jgi:hypothetical protein
MADDEDHERVPIAYWLGSHPVPDLDAIPEDRWPGVLRQIPGHIRHKAAGLLVGARMGAAMKVVIDLAAEESRRLDEAYEKVGFPGPLPSPNARKARLSRHHQVSFRLTPGQYSQTVDAANALGLKPAQLARLLTLRGVAQVLAEDA